MLKWEETKHACSIYKFTVLIFFINKVLNLTCFWWVEIYCVDEILTWTTLTLIQLRELVIKRWSTFTKNFSSTNTLTMMKEYLYMSQMTKFKINLFSILISMPQQNSTFRIFQNRNIAVDLHLVSSTNVNNIRLAGHRTVAVINIQNSARILKRLFCGQTKSDSFDSL